MGKFQGEKRERDVSLDGNGVQGRGGTFSSKKSKLGTGIRRSQMEKRKRQERTRGQMTSGY